MSGNFTHLVLTRFNTAIGYAPSLRRLDSDWLRERLILFERFCMPSMAAQQDAQFQWVVFFDAASPAWFKDKIKSYGTLIMPLYIDGLATDPVIAERVARTGLVSSQYLVTTRLDNDDALASNHLATVQKAFRSQEREFVVFPFGLQCFRDHLYDVYWPTNPFLSLIERVQDGNRFTTVFCVPHQHVRQAGRVRLLMRSPQWLQVLHSSNILNGLRGIPRLSSRSHRDFNVRWSELDARDSFIKRLGLSTSTYGNRASRLVQRTVARLHDSVVH